MLAITGLVVGANYLAKKPTLPQQTLFDWFLLLLNIPVVMLGGIFMVASLLAAEQITQFAQQAGLPLINWDVLGFWVLMMGVWGMLVSAYPVRRLLAQGLPFDPASPVHTLAWVLSGYLVGNTLVTLTQGGLEGLADSAVSATIWDVLVQQLLFVALAVLGVGWFIRRDGAQVVTRLGLQRLTAAQIAIGLRWIVLLVLLQAAGGATWAYLEPEQFEQFEGLNGQLLGGFDTFGEWVILAVATGVGEELLFRGALQPVFGVGFTAVLFAIAHVQYGLTPVTVVVFIIGAVLGHLRRQHHTTLTIFVHGGYNFVLGLLSLLALYAERFTS